MPCFTVSCTLYTAALVRLTQLALYTYIYCVQYISLLLYDVTRDQRGFSRKGLLYFVIAVGIKHYILYHIITLSLVQIWGSVVRTCFEGSGHIIIIILFPFRGGGELNSCDDCQIHRHVCCARVVYRYHSYIIYRNRGIII